MRGAMLVLGLVWLEEPNVVLSPAMTMSIFEERFACYRKSTRRAVCSPSSAWLDGHILDVHYLRCALPQGDLIA